MKIAQDTETVILEEEAKGSIVAERKYICCYVCRKDGNLNYVKLEIRIYLRKYVDGR